MRYAILRSTNPQSSRTDKYWITLTKKDFPSLLNVLPENGLLSCYISLAAHSIQTFAICPPRLFSLGQRNETIVEGWCHHYGNIISLLRAHDTNAWPLNFHSGEDIIDLVIGESQIKPSQG